MKSLIKKWLKSLAYVLYVEVLFVALLTIGVVIIAVTSTRETFKFFRRFLVLRKYVRGDIDVVDLMITMSESTEMVYLNSENKKMEWR